MLKLYYAPGACSLSPHIALRESGLPFELVKVDWMNGRTLANGEGVLADVNAKDYVPALRLDDDQVLTEGVAIVQYIADRAPDSKLAPANGTLARVRLQEWLNFISTELHKSFGTLFNPQAPEAWKDLVKTQLARRFDYVNSRLDGKVWLMGDDFTVVDAYLFTVLGWGNYVGVDLAPWPNLIAYQGRVAARPAVQAALKAEGLIE